MPSVLLPAASVSAGGEVVVTITCCRLRRLWGCRGDAACRVHLCVQQLCLRTKFDANRPDRQEFALIGGTPPTSFYLHRYPPPTFSGDHDFSGSFSGVFQQDFEYIQRRVQVAGRFERNRQRTQPPPGPCLHESVGRGARVVVTITRRRVRRFW